MPKELMLLIAAAIVAAFVFTMWVNLQILFYLGG